MNKQEIFDLMVSSVIKQGEPSVYNGSCRYRGPGGLKCAFGFLISDDVYSTNMESLPARTVITTFRGLEKYKEHIDLITEIQRNHDNESDTIYLSDFVPAFKIRCKRTAKNLNLVWNHGEL
jgi:hypothetical protein